MTRISRRELLALPVALALLAPAAPALGQTTTSTTGTSGYNQKPPTPTEPKKAVEPEKEAAKTEPKAAVEPAKAAEPAKATTLPFTGLNLTWVLAGGVLLLGAGFALRLGLRTRAPR